MKWNNAMYLKILATLITPINAMYFNHTYLESVYFTKTKNFLLKIV